MKQMMTHTTMMVAQSARDHARANGFERLSISVLDGGDFVMVTVDRDGESQTFSSSEGGDDDECSR